MATETTEIRVAAAHQVQARLREATAINGLDALVATSPENFTYAAGAIAPSMRTVRSRLAACVIPTGGETEVIVVNVDAALLRERACVDTVNAYQEFDQHPIDVLADSVRARGLDSGRIGIETSYLSYDDHQRLAVALPKAQLESADALLAETRVLKQPAEIEAIRRIGVAAERIASECVALVGLGDTERDLAALIEEHYAAAGGERLDMLVVASGPRSAHPNAPATDRELQDGEVVRIDIIGTAGNYYSDVARTAVLGEPGEELQRIYDLLLSVHERTLDALRPGIPCSDVFQIYEYAMRDAGLPAYHFVGHGLGVTLHEDPFISASSSRLLEEGMVLCIEPLTMLDGRFGVQIEDEVLIKAGGCEPLTRADGLLRIEA